MDNTIWLTARDAARLCHKSHVWLHECRKANMYQWRANKGKGGLQWEVSLVSLPSDAQVKYWAEQNVPAAPVCSEDVKEHESQLYNEAPDYNRRKADKYRALLLATENLRGNALKDEIERWNASNPEFATSYRSLMRIRKDYAERGIESLLGAYGKTRNRALSVEQLGEFGERCFEYFKSIYLSQSAPTAQQTYYATRGYGIELYAKLNTGDVSAFDTQFPSQATFTRKLERELGESAIYLARNGWDAWNRKFGNHLTRDYSNVRAGEIWVSDHHQLDVLCTAPDGSLKRAWLTAWICMKSHKFLSYELALGAPNSDRIINTFADGIESYGVPQDILIDNGKDYRAKDFANGRHTVKINIDETRARSLTGQLGVKVHFALPYNAQSKPIERMFRYFTEWFAKRIPGYTGRNTVERPAEQLEKQIERGEILSFNQVRDLLHFFVEEIFNQAPSSGKNHQGQSPNQLFQTEYPGLPRVRTESLALLRTRVSGERRIGRNGVRDAETDDWYWGEWMEPIKGRKVYIRRSPNKWQEAFVFDAATDEYLGMARLGAWTTPVLAGTDVERENLRAVARRKNQLLKATKALAAAQQQVSPQEQLRHLALGLGTTGNIAVERSNVTILTEMDTAYDSEMQYRATGTHDLSAILPPEESNSEPLRIWEED